MLADESRSIRYPWCRTPSQARPPTRPRFDASSLAAAERRGRHASAHAAEKLLATFRRPFKAALHVGPSVGGASEQVLDLECDVDCSDAEVMARFWSEVTRWPRSKVEMPGNPFWWVGPR